MELIQIQWTVASLDEARRLARYLIQERLAAKAEVIPWIESIVMLNNQLETSQESKIVILTAKELYGKVEEVLVKGASFEIAECIVFPVSQVNSDFLHWIEESLRIPVGN